MFALIAASDAPLTPLNRLIERVRPYPRRRVAITTGRRQVYRRVVLTMHFIDTAQYQFTRATRDALTAVGEAADAAVRDYIEPVADMTVMVESSVDVLETGDNAATLEPGLIRWWFDPNLDVVQLANDHFARAFAHEAFHATRFRTLRSEASAPTWLDIAINEGLATTFARDIAGAYEPWSTYDPHVIEEWCRELLSLDTTTATLSHWKFQHPDGRQWIAFRVGTWIIDTSLEPALRPRPTSSGRHLPRSPNSVPS